MRRQFLLYGDFVGGPFRSLNAAYKDKQRHGFSDFKGKKSCGGDMDYICSVCVCVCGCRRSPEFVD